MNLVSNVSFKGQYFDQKDNLQHTTPAEDEKELSAVLKSAGALPADKVDISLNSCKHVQMVMKEKEDNPVTFILMGTGMVVENAARTLCINFEELTQKGSKLLGELQKVLRQKNPEVFGKYEAEQDRASGMAYQLQDALNRATVEQVKKALDIKE